MKTFIVTGTDTGLGKTVFSAALCAALLQEHGGASYWKPVQAGFEGGTDSDVVAELSGAKIIPEAYRLTMPASPHRAAAADGVVINPAALILPRGENALVVEGAGGLMVPLTQDTLFIDVFARWNAPLILCARTSLGTINHTLLSLEAIRARNIPLLGVAFIGQANDDSEQTICRLGQAKRLGRLGPVAPLARENLAKAFAEGFKTGDFS